MTKIRNDPKAYKRRSDFRPNGSPMAPTKLPASEAMARLFQTASWDDRLYVDLRFEIDAAPQEKTPLTQRPHGRRAPA